MEGVHHGAVGGHRLRVLVSGWFALRDLGAAQVKGASELVRVFELKGVGESRLGAELGA